MNNIKQMKNKEKILAALVVLAILFSFLSLAFYVFRLTDDTQNLLELVGYGSLSGLANMSGFDFISNIDSATGVFKTYAVLDIFVLIISIVMMLAFVYIFLCKDEENRKKAYKALLALAVMISVYTLIEGIHLSSKADKEFWGGVGDNADEVKALGDFGMVTDCYWPLIITAIIVVAYLLVFYKMPETIQTEVVSQTTMQESVENQGSSESETKREIAFSEDDKVELLRKWKGLLDDGVITLNEYEEKKQELLKKD